jgi:hypothetical protein
MKSSDLRIGNIVAVCYEEKVTPDTVVVLEPGVVHLSSRKNADSDRDIVGVPLQEEWLRKFNFKYNSHSDKWKLNKIIIKKIQSGNVNIWLVQSKTLQMKIAFVHQLQDLLHVLVISD